MPTKISNFPTSSNPALNDLIPIIDVSETNTSNQNKKVTVSTLLNLSGGNPYLQTSIEPGAILPDLGTSTDSILLGNEILNIVNPVLTNPGDSMLAIGNYHKYHSNITDSTILGYSNGIYNSSYNSFILGSNSFVGLRSDLVLGQPRQNVNSDAYYSVLTGDSLTAMAPHSVLMGTSNIIFEGADYSIAIGSQISIGSSSTLNNNAPIDSSNSIAIGSSTSVGAKYGTCIGSYGYISEGANDAIAIGAGYANALESISIGLYSYTNGPASISIGARASSNSATGSAIAIGDAAAARAPFSVVIGGNSGVRTTSTNSIVLGDNSGIGVGTTGVTTDAIVIGYNTEIGSNSSNSIAIGSNCNIFENCSNNIVLGSNSTINAGITNSVLLGTGTITSSDNLQFNNTSIADANLGIKAKLNASAPIVDNTKAGVIAINNSIPQYVNNSGVWTNISSVVTPTVTGTIRLRRITTGQSLSANTFTTVLFNQVLLSSIGVAIGSFNTSSGVLTLNSTGKYEFTGYLTLNGGVVGTRTIFFADNPTTGSFDHNTRLECAIISQAAGSFILPINFTLEVIIAPTTFTFISGSSTSVSIAQSNFTLSTYAESQITVVKLS